MSPSRAPPSPTPPTPPRPASPPSFQYVQHLRQCPLSVVVGVSGGWCVPRVAEGGWPLVGFPPGPPSFFLFGGGSCSSWDLRYPTRLSFATPLPPPPPPRAPQQHPAPYMHCMETPVVSWCRGDGGAQGVGWLVFLFSFFLCRILGFRGWGWLATSSPPTAPHPHQPTSPPTHRALLAGITQVNV